MIKLLTKDVVEDTAENWGRRTSRKKKKKINKAAVRTIEDWILNANSEVVRHRVYHEGSLNLPLICQQENVPETSPDWRSIVGEYSTTHLQSGDAWGTFSCWQICWTGIVKFTNGGTHWLAGVWLATAPRLAALSLTWNMHCLSDTWVVVPDRI